MTQSGLQQSVESQLLLLEVPRSVPSIIGRSCRQAVDAFDERHRRSVVGNGFERRGKGAACLVPTSCSVGGEPFREAGPKLDLRRGQLALAPHDLEHRLWLGLTKQYDSINFARLDGGGARNGETRTRPPYTLLTPSRRDARFTVSPITV
jgi:hypothetical protein